MAALQRLRLQQPTIRKYHQRFSIDLARSGDDTCTLLGAPSSEQSIERGARAHAKPAGRELLRRFSFEELSGQQVR
jgi:hypothetical protein